MSGLSRRAAAVEHEMGTAWTKYHVGAQAVRFVIGVGVALAWSLHSGFGDWTDLLPLLGTAAWTTLEHMYPRLPWDLVWEHFEPRKPEPAAPAASAAEAPAASGSAAADADPAPSVKG